MADTFFVFVVCGADKHIETLNYSLRFLRRFTKNPVLVVTDPSRNSLAIEHPDVVAVETPKAMDHRRAAIFLKTGLARILPLEGRTYCYLDSDILALGPEVDRVFSFHKNPVDFASDHCALREFSPWAANCGCLEKMQEETRILAAAVEKAWPYKLSQLEIKKRTTELSSLLARWEARQLSDPALVEKRRRLDRLTMEYEREKEELKRRLSPKDLAGIERLVYGSKLAERNRLFRALPEPARKALRFLLYRAGSAALLSRGLRLKSADGTWTDRAGKKLFSRDINDFETFYKKNGPFVWDGEARTWSDTEGNLLFDEKKHNFAKFLDEAEGFFWDPETRRWTDPEGEVIYDVEFEESCRNFYREVESMTYFRYDFPARKWRNREGDDVFYCECTHLMELINERFGIEITEDRWVHPNGGMFLFSERSRAFMDTWQEYSLAVMDDPKWRVRDQGALAAAFFRHGLQDAERVPVEYNFIADYYKTTIAYQGGLRFRLLPELVEVAPRLLHVYHHFGDSSWKVWRDVEALMDAPAPNGDGTA